MLAERLQRSPIGACEIVAYDQRQIERLGDGLDAADQVDRRSDHREVEAVRRSDVAIDDRAIVKRDDDFERWVAGLGRIRPQDAERRLRLWRRRERVCRGAGGLVRMGHWKDRKQSVADEFQNFTAMAYDRLRLQVEQIVENANHALAGQLIGHLSEAAQIRRPKYGGNRFAAAAPDLTGQHLPSGLRSEIGLEDVFRDLS